MHLFFFSFRFWYQHQWRGIHYEDNEETSIDLTFNKNSLKAIRISYKIWLPSFFQQSIIYLLVLSLQDTWSYFRRLLLPLVIHIFSDNWRKIEFNSYFSSGEANLTKRKMLFLGQMVTFSIPLRVCYEIT